MAYRAEIEIGVRGTEKLRELRSTIEDISKRVNKLDELANVFQAPIQSINNYNRSLQIAADALRKVELGREDEATAIKTYVRAMGEANEAQARQNRLIQQTIKLFEEEERVRRLTAAGIFETTRFSQPIGPARPSGAVPAGGFPVAGPLQSPGFQKTQKSVGSFGENLALGAGFPLLFGGGPGAVLGSVAGSFVGSGFGGQILGGALGQILDQAVQKTAQLGSALQTLNLDKFRESGIQVNAVLETQITLLRQAGDAAGAQALAQQQVLAVTGALPGTVEDISNATNILGSAWSEFTATAGVTLGIVGAPFAAALGAIINAVNLIVRGINVALSAVGTALKVTGEWVTKLIGGEEAVKNIQENFKNLNAEIQKARAEYQPILASLNGEILLNRELLNLEKQKTTTSTAAGKQRNADLAFQQAVIKTNAETEDKIREANSKITEATKVQVAEQVRQLNVRRDQTIEAAKLTKELELQRIAEAEREKALRAAEESQRRAEASLKARMNIQKSIFDEQMKLVDINIRQQEFAGGEEAGLRRSLGLTDARARLTVAILETERKAAIEEARQTGTVAEVVRLYDAKLRNAQYELNLQRDITQARLNQLQVEKQLAAARREQGIEDVAIPIQRRQEDVRLGIAGFGQSEQLLEQQRLALEQRRRLEDGELPILREIAALQTEINGGGLAADALAAKEADLDASQRKLGVLREELTLLDQLEQRQLRLQQFFASYGQLIQSVSGEIANAVTFGVSEMVRGTKTAEQVFADFLNAVGNALMQAAQTMIAQYIAIGIAKIFAGLGSGGLGSMGGGGGFGSFSGGSIGVGGMSLPGLEGAGALASASPFSYAGVVMRAGGGPAVGGTPYLVGERGPELFVPGSSGGVMSNNDLRQSMNGGGSPVLNMSFETTRFGDTEYVSRDQLEAAMSETRRQASRDGAQRGMTMTLDRLQQSPRTRSRLGMR